MALSLAVEQRLKRVKLDELFLKHVSMTNILDGDFVFGGQVS
jgi:hypothetical protein